MRPARHLDLPLGLPARREERQASDGKAPEREDPGDLAAHQPGRAHYGYRPAPACVGLRHRSVSLRRVLRVRRPLSAAPCGSRSRADVYHRRAAACQTLCPAAPAPAAPPRQRRPGGQRPEAAARQQHQHQLKYVTPSRIRRSRRRRSAARRLRVSRVKSPVRARHPPVGIDQHRHAGVGAPRQRDPRFHAAHHRHLGVLIGPRARGRTTRRWLY